VNHENEPSRPAEETCRQDPQDRGPAAALDLAAILGPRAGAITAAAQARQGSAGGSQIGALGYLAASGAFVVPRPTRPPDKYGAEHDVFLASNGIRVVKFARNFGFIPGVAGDQVIMKPATPQEYLARHSLMERIFPTDIRLEGLTDDGHFVISQRVIVGNHPPEHTVREYLLSLDFVNLPARFGQGGGAWFHKGVGVLIMDTSPDNFVASAQGIVPIDLQIAELDGAFLKLVAAAEMLLRQAPKITH